MTTKKARSGTASRVEALAPETALDLISIIVIDDNRLLREGIASMIRSQTGFRVLAAAADAEEALETVRTANPDIVLVDLGLENDDSLTLTATICRDVPKARVIVMGLLPAQEDVANFVRAGASGFIMKDASFEEFLATIRAVAAGEEILPAALTTSLFTQIVKNIPLGSPAQIMAAVQLTPREVEVINLLGEGLSNKAIAVRLHIAVHTVKSHVHNILEKLALRSRLEVVAFSHRARGQDDGDG